MPTAEAMNLEEIDAQLRDGKTVPKIAAEIGVSSSALYQALHRAGYSYQKRNVLPSVDVLNTMRKSMSLSEIGQLFGVTRQAVSVKIKREQRNAN